MVIVTKNKWDSQYIQKHFKNKHHNNSQNLSRQNCAHSTFFVRECNEIIKYHSSMSDHEMCLIEEENVPSDIANQRIPATVTFGDYLPPILDTLVNIEDDTD